MVNYRLVEVMWMDFILRNILDIFIIKRRFMVRGMMSNKKSYIVNYCRFGFDGYLEYIV